jgi:glycosyltransferase involved in cell wall biosynthesis
MRERVNRFDRLLIPTSFMRDIFVRNGVDPKLVEVVPYGVNVAVARDGADRGVSGELRIGFIGAIVDFKGVHLLIEAVRKLEGLPIDLQIYGKLDANPDYAARLRALAARDPRVRFLGTFPNAEIGRVIAGMDALALPSTWHENTPLVVYSAQAAACPVIATNLGGIAEVVHDGVNGLLFEKGDVAGIASAIRRLHEDRALLRKLSAASKPPRTIAQYVDDLERVYGEVAARPS